MKIKEIKKLEITPYPISVGKILCIEFTGNKRKYYIPIVSFTNSLMTKKEIRNYEMKVMNKNGDVKGKED